MRRYTVLYLSVTLACIFINVTGCLNSPVEPSKTVTINNSTATITETNKPKSTSTPTNTKTLTPTKTTIPTNTVEASQDVKPPVLENQNIYKNTDPSGQDILFWHHYTKSRARILQEIVDDFNVNNEWGISISATYQGYYNYITKDLWEVLNTPYSPNLIMVFQNQASSYQLNNSLVNIDNFINSPRWGLSEQDLIDFFPSMLSQDISPIFDNARLGFPPFRSMDVLYYNVDWLAELGYDHPPSTPLEFQEMSCKAVQQPYSKAIETGSNGYGLNMDASRIASWAFAHGGNIFNPNTKLYSYNSQEVQNAMHFIQDMINNGCATIVTEPYGDQEDFGKGSLLFTVGTSAGIPYYDQAVLNGANFRWNVAAIPHVTNDPIQNVYGVSFSVPKSTPEKELAAWLFVKYFSDPNVQEKWVKVSGYFPVRKSAANNLSDYFQENEAYKTAWGLLESSTYEPSVPGYELVRQKASESLAAIANGGDVISILLTLNEEANTILSEQMPLLLIEGTSVP